MGYKTSQEFAEEFYKEQEEAHANPAAHRGMNFPVAWLMKQTGGFKPSWLCYWYGQAKAGKTTAMVTSAKEGGHNGRRFCYFALEEPNSGLAGKLFAAEGQISRTKLRDVKLEAADWPHMMSARATISNFNGFWSDDCYDITDMLAVINATDPDDIYVDHIQLMNPIRRTNNSTKTMEVSENSRTLKMIANGAHKGLKIHRPRCVIVGAQLNADGDPLYSKDLDRDADITVEIRLVDDGFGESMPDRRKMVIRKFRHGDPGSTVVGFDGEHSLIKEYTIQQSSARVAIP